MKKQAKQIAKSKRVGFAVLLNTGWILSTLSQLQQVKDSADALTRGYPWGEYIGMSIVALSFAGIVWTKLHDDAAGDSDAN